MGVCNCSMFCCTLLYVHSSIAIILMGKGELVALLNLSSWCLMMVERLVVAVPWGCLRFVIVVFPDHAHLLFLVPRIGPGSLALLPAFIPSRLKGWWICAIEKKPVHKAKYLSWIQILAFQKSWGSFSPIIVCILARCMLPF